MPWNKQHYREVRKWMEHMVSHRPFLSTCECPFEWAIGFYPLIVDCVHREDYEGAKAARDAIIHFFNKFLPKQDKIKRNQILKLPEYKETKTEGIICTCH